MRIILIVFYILNTLFCQSQSSDVPNYVIGIKNTTECDYILYIQNPETNFVIYFDTILSGDQIIVQPTFNKRYLMRMESINDCLPDCKTGEPYPLNEVRRLKGMRGDEKQTLYIKPGWFFHIRSPLCVRM